MLDHFQTLARKLEADRLAWNTQTAAINESINNETARLHVLQRQDDKKEIAASQAKLHKLKKERAALTPPSFVNPLPIVEQFARTHRNAKPLPAIAVKVPNGQTPLAAHNNAAEKTNKVLADITRMERVPINDPAAIAAQVDALAAPARVLNGRVILPQKIARGLDGTTISIIDAEGLFAWLHRDALIRKLQDASEPLGMTRAERDKELARLYAEFESALRYEAAAAMAAEKAGQSVIRRRHVHPAVLLNLPADAREVYQWHAERKGV